MVARRHLVLGILPQTFQVQALGIGALWQDLMRNCQPTVIRLDVGVATRAIIPVEYSLLNFSRMERGCLELFYAAVALLSLMHIKGNTAVLVDIFAEGVAARRTQAIHWKVNTADLVTMKLPCLATMQLAEPVSDVWSAFQ